MPSLPLPSFADVEDAAQRLADQAYRTPVITSRHADERAGARLFFKCENFQRMGAFKFRGAFNALSRLDPARRRAGVVAFSSGNHAQAVALAARLLGLSATIVMPLDAPAAKVAATRGYGGRIVTYDRYTEDREQIAADLAAREGLTVVPPFDHPDVIAGQGTAARELFDEVGELDALFVPLGGGGLLSGTALSTRAMSPACRLVGVEPATGNDGQQSFQRGELVTIAPPRTLADGAQTSRLGDYTFAIIRRDVQDVTTATDDELVAAMRFAAGYMKLVIEPTGCLGIAAALRPDPTLEGRRIGIIVSGGNVDLARYGALLGEADRAD